MRAEDEHSWKARAIAVAIAAAYAYFLVRTAGAVTLVSAPIFPFTSIGIADHFSERKHEHETARV